MRKPFWITPTSPMFHAMHWGGITIKCYAAVCSSLPGMRRDSVSRNQQICTTWVPVVMWTRYSSFSGSHWIESSVQGAARWKP